MVRINPKSLLNPNYVSNNNLVILPNRRVPKYKLLFLFTHIICKFIDSRISPYTGDFIVKEGYVNE